jgi:putative ABC transport system substrate-binding protein
MKRYSTSVISGVMERREFFGLCGAAIAMVLSLLSSAEVQTKRPLIVWFGSGTEAAVGRYRGALRSGLEELGYTEPRNFELLTRLAENRVERLPALAEEVVRLNPAVIVAGAVDAAVAAKRASSTIPIVSAALADAEHLGLVRTYAQPGGNVAGIVPYVAGLPAKQLELAREIVPEARKIGLLGNMYDPKASPQREEINNAAQKSGITVIVPEIGGPHDVPGAIQTLANEQVQVVIVLETTMLLSLRKQIAPFGETIAGRLRVQRACGRGRIDQLRRGSESWQRLATYIEKILSGSAPANLPVEFPTKLLMVVNIKTAEQLGINIPQQLLARADEVIEA